MASPVRIITPRFLLRSLTPEDAGERYSAWFDDPEAARFIETARQPHDVESLRRYIESRCERADVLFLGIFLRDAGTHIGNIKYEPVDEKARYAVMGVFIGEREWQRRNVAREVIGASAEWLAKNRNIAEIVLGVDERHTAAITAYERIGFVAAPSTHIHQRTGSVVMTLRPDSSGFR